MGRRQYQSLRDVSADAIERRARDVLARLSVISNGSTVNYGAGHATFESRPPLSLEGVRLESRGDRPPPKDQSLYLHYAWHFARARSHAWLLGQVERAEEDLDLVFDQNARRTTQLPDDELVPELLAMRDPPELVAVRLRVTAAFVRKTRVEHERDPLTGSLWPADVGERRLEYARELAATGEYSQRRIAEMSGVPRSTLQRRLQN